MPQREVHSIIIFSITKI
jgi:hypothetical protein